MTKITKGLVTTPLEMTVVLIGLMGAGKSCVGRHLADRLGLPFVDADAEIEKAAGCSITDIFECYGEDAFRDGERKIIKRFLTGNNCILATGGGAFMDSQIRGFIKANAISIWLRADIQILIRRTKGRNHRPLLNNPNPNETLARLIDERYPIYEKADVIVDAHDDSPDVTCENVLAALETHIGCKLSVSSL